MACSCLKEEFQLDNLDFDHSTGQTGVFDWKVKFGHDPDRCFANHSTYLITRILLFSLMFIVLIWSIVDWVIVSNHGFGHWFIYLTHWGLIIEVAYLGLAVYTTHKSKHSTEEEITLPFYVKVTWFLKGLILPCSFLIFALYWGLVFDGNIYLVSVFTHGVNFLVMLVDSMLSSAPYLILHGLYFFTFAIFYVTWSYIHYKTGLVNEEGKPYIYSSLDWSQSGTKHLSAIILFLAVPIVNMIFWLIVKHCNKVKLRRKSAVSPMK